MSDAHRSTGRFRASIGFKLATVTMSILLVAAAAISWTLVERERRALFERKERTTVRLAEQLALALTAPLEFDDDVAVAEVLASIIDDRELVSLRLVDRDRGALVATKGLAGPPDELALRGRSVLWTDDALWISRRVAGDGIDVQGTLVMGLSIAAERAQWTRQRDLILLASVVLALLVAVSLVAATRKLVVQPMSRLANAADAFGHGARIALPPAGDDEVGRVTHAFATMMDAIDERELRIAAAHAEVEQLLDAMRQAVFGFSADLTVIGRSSRAAREMFGGDLHGVDVRDLLLSGVPEGSPEELATCEFLELVFNVPADAWDQAVELAPHELCIDPDTPDERNLVLEFVPLRDEDELVRVMVVVTDETEARRMRREMRTLEDRHTAELAATRRLLGLGAHVFVEFAATTKTRLDHVLHLIGTPTPAILDETVRKLHAARGDARALGLVELARVLTVAEATVAEARDSKDPPPAAQWTTALRSQLALADAELVAARDRLVDASPLGEEVLDQVMVSARDLDALEEHRARASTALVHCIDRLHGRLLGALVVGLDEAVGAWAAADGKRIELEVVGAATRIGGATAGPLRTAIVQLVRNAVAHGIELPTARDDAGKPIVGSLRIVGSSDDRDELPVIEVIDDGVGVDWAALASRATARGIKAAPAELPFVDGLSTRSEVDALAGRGAGLAAVRDELAAVGYAIRITSEPGTGTTVRIAPHAARAGAAIPIVARRASSIDVDTQPNVARNRRSSST